MALLASLVATTVSATFCWRLARRWHGSDHRNPALLAWTISLGMFAVASGLLVVGVVGGFSSVVFRLFYLFGAVLNVPWLALGSVLVNAPDRWTTRAVGIVTILVGAAFLPGVARGDTLATTGAVVGIGWGALQVAAGRDTLRTWSAVLLLGYSLAAALVVLPAGFEAPLPTAGLPEGRELFGSLPRSFAVGGNAVGSMVVIVGALLASGRLLWQALADRRRAELAQVGRRRPVDAIAEGLLGGWRAVQDARLDHVVRGNLLVALGVVLAAGSGGMFSFLGDTTAHAIGLGLGVAVMFAGFERTTRPVASSA